MLKGSVAAALLTLKEHFAEKCDSGMGKIVFGDGIITIEYMDYYEECENKYIITEEYYESIWDADGNEWIVRM